MQNTNKGKGLGMCGDSMIFCSYHMDKAFGGY